MAFSEGKKLTLGAANPTEPSATQAVSRRWFAQALLRAIARKWPTRLSKMRLPS